MKADKFDAFILYQLTQCIIQSRIDISRAQMSKFNQYVTWIAKNKFYQGHKMIISEMLQKLITTPRLNIFNQMKLMNKSMHVLIILTLKNAQIWSIQISKETSLTNGMAWQAVGELFEEILLLLNKAPLLSECMDDRNKGQTYKISYNLYYETQTNQHLIASILQGTTTSTSNFYTKYILQRLLSTDSSLRIHITCSHSSNYQSIQQLTNINDIIPIKINVAQQIKPNQQTLNCMQCCNQLQQQQQQQLQQQMMGESEYITIQQQIDENMLMKQNQQEQSQQIRSKVSYKLCEYYDNNLEITILSNNQSYFSSTMGLIKHIQLDILDIKIDQRKYNSNINYENVINNVFIKKGISEEYMTQLEQQQQNYEMLDISADQKWINQNLVIFRDLGIAESELKNSDWC